MSRPKSRRRRAIAVLLVCLLTCVVSAQEVSVLFRGPSEPVTAGTRVPLWLNVLNISDREIVWHFPPSVRCQIRLGQEVFGRELRLADPATNRVSILPGGFARREYWLELPEKAVGSLVIEFTDVFSTSIHLESQSAPSEPARGSGFSRALQEAEPVKPGQPFDPGRFFKEHFSGYEPFYFIAGPDSPTAKFQFSFKYQLLSSEGPIAKKAPLVKGLNFAYTQTSLWDLASDSAPFLDSSYKPELLYVLNRVYVGGRDDWFKLDLQTGLQHESNGKDGLDSRSLNIAYLRPTLTLGEDDGFQFTLQPRAWLYLGDLSDNPDIARYRGYVDLRAILGWRRGLQLSALGRVGDHADRGSIQLDLTYPMMEIWSNFSVYLQIQYFNGYGESLLEYNERSSTIRFGIALYR